MVGPGFRDDHILLIAPGSKFTLAQLGLPESFTPAKLRFPTRMFPGLEEGQYLPNKVHELKEGEEMLLRNGEVMTAGPNGKPLKKRKVDSASKPSTTTQTAAGGTTKPTDGKGDTTMADAADDREENEDEGGDDDEEMNGTKEEGANSKLFYEDDDDEEGAVWCLEQGRIVNWEAFFALLLHIHETLNPTFHTPILMISQPCWTCTDKERICQFIFEKLKTPGFGMMDAAAAINAAYNVQHSLVIDVGYEKTDITALIDWNIQEVNRTTIPFGGNSMNKHLHKLLPDLTEEEIDQLKRSNICEILPLGVPIPGEEDIDKDEVLRPAEPTTIGMGGIAQPKALDEEGDEEEEEGVTNIAAIVASGKTQEYLAKKEKEKADKKAGLAAGEKRLPNFKREKNSFLYVEKVHDSVMEDGKTDHPTEILDGERMDVDVAPPTTEEPKPVEESSVTSGIDGSLPASSEEKQPEATKLDTEGSKVAPDADPSKGGPSLMESMFSGTKDDDDAKRAQEKALRREEKKRQEAAQSGERRKEIEVGTERFKAAEGGILEAIADAAHRVVSSADNYNLRSECWNSVIIAGGGCRVKGFKDALLNTIVSKYQVSPSSGTIFTSELPSNIPTPSGTGTNTPQPSAFNSQQPNALLLQAAANNAALAAAGQHHLSIPQPNQGPTSIKIAKIPEYFPEWKDHGFDECMFLGAQLGAKIYFVTDQGANKGFVTRADYNSQGPQAIHNI
ncbi:Actin-like protein arp9 (SWI/SNF complex component arp9) [Orbilia oligospora]|uniref:Actin-like protein arp9 (SWI/SNF complex component arp9) n=1 Tax=Orbilia oligospora TaxID=2813651 RepID=A0A6G1MEN6_ORBOL|nr:Actin-like protein arp9 (SWI/SNF complex component arp9) [Orbilia oligospora]KAF3217355.1 Actin-like protein arp9 (SWI/SNF complex component arp9) [Orbilia oligospora]KAF3224421.1 Actin-like protein arp9 (SWI/SNF complex component arp9) [Orbilia oligospora]KAF3231823.1 Actin-like protein arp9 (SWI/SNF complex component arp9) [Orbilia oligospora]KAF3255761.1 Actin-like protein arp9 (SWI/SNF complex component arp9) [Orbilia oligospora]